MNIKKVRKIDNMNLFILIEGLFVLLVLISGIYTMFLKESGLPIVISSIYFQFIAILSAGFFLIYVGNKLLKKESKAIVLGMTALSVIISMLILVVSIEYGYAKLYNPNDFNQVLVYDVLKYMPVIVFGIVILFTILTVFYFIESLIREYKYNKQQKETIEEIIRKLIEENDAIENLINFDEAKQIVEEIKKEEPIEVVEKKKIVVKEEKQIKVVEKEKSVVKEEKQIKVVEKKKTNLIKEVILDSESEKPIKK